MVKKGILKFQKYTRYTHKNIRSQKSHFGGENLETGFTHVFL